MESSFFTISRPTVNPIPVILSFPHSGTGLPGNLAHRLIHEKAKALYDTDWELPWLYSFALEMGITVIKSELSRWVADLNRDPTGKGLYSDGRIITDVVPLTDFNGAALYRDGCMPDGHERELRILQYHTPYHEALKELTSSFIESHGKVLLWDAHSIVRMAPGIRKEPFPDFIIGNDDGRTCSKSTESILFKNLSEAGYDVRVNEIFKGGYITRNHANKDRNIETVQLEMAKDLYLKEDRWPDEKKGAKVRSVLKSIFGNLSEKFTVNDRKNN